MKDSAVRNPSAAHRPHQKRKRVRRRRIFRAIALSEPLRGTPLTLSRKQTLYFQISFLALTRL